MTALTPDEKLCPDCGRPKAGAPNTWENLGIDERDRICGKGIARIGWHDEALIDCNQGEIRRLRAENARLSAELIETRESLLHEEAGRATIAAERERYWAEVERLRAERQWIPVVERMPEHYETVLVPGGLALFDGSGWRTMMGTDSGRLIQWPVTHWQPLPEPPK